MNLIDHLNWRYATKIFNKNRKVSEKDLNFLQEAVRLSVSSYGLQLYKVLIIEDKQIRKDLRKASWDQAQITDASHLFIFCNYTVNFDQLVDDYVQRIIEMQAKSPEAVRQYGESIKKSISNMTAEKRQNWVEKQTYLALNNLLIACAELKIDSCPMEGFENEMYNEILGLNELGLNAAVIAPIGYRSERDETQHRKKVRKSIEELFEIA